jgi:hypothetical protein
MVVVLEVIVTSGSTVVEVIEIGLLVAGADAQARSLVIMTVTTSPSLSVVVVKVGELLPAFTPLTCHWYNGFAPPSTGVAVNVIDVPGQIDVELAIMLTSGLQQLDVIITGLLVAVGVDTQARSLVIITVTISPSCNDVVVKFGEFVPTLVPLTCHW